MRHRREFIFVATKSLIKLNVSVVSVVKAWSSLINPSIIISYVCHPLCHPTLWRHCLSSKQLEPRLRPVKVSRGYTILPERVTKNAPIASSGWCKTFLVYNMFTLILIKRMKDLNRNLFKNCLIKRIQKRNATVIDSSNNEVRNKNEYCNKLNCMTCWSSDLFVRNKNENGKLNCTRCWSSDKFVRNSCTWMCGVILQSCDIETNPGPIDVTLVTLNCRGLKNETKFKQLLNRIHNSHTHDKNLIVALQETHVENNQLKYMWKGQHIFTGGEGSKGGVITLLSDNIRIKETVDLGNEAHIAAVDVLNENQQNELIIANLHAPCAHNSEKLNFFNNIRTEINKLLVKDQDSKCVLLGDYNTTFGDHERSGTVRSTSEISIANKLTESFDDLYLVDCWRGDYHTMT